MVITIMKKIKIHFLFLVLLLFAFMIGLVKEMFFILICFTIHELGHYFFINLFKYKVSNITIYPFGGIINYQEKNDFIYKTILIMCGGVLFNLIFVFVFNIIGFKMLAQINFYFFLINILPINPLDGGKILILLLSLFLPNRLSKIIVYILSIVLIIFFMFIFKLDGLYFYFVFAMLLKENVFSIINVKKEYKKFVLLKHLNPNDKLKIKETKFWINNPIESLFIGRNMIFDYETFKVSEEDILKRYYKTKKD